MTDLTGRRVAFLLTDGFEDSELISPWTAVTSAGTTAVLVSPTAGSVTGKKGHVATVDLSTAAARATDFDALMLPGGAANSDSLRRDGHAVRFAREFFDRGKPVGVICHGGWILADADVVRGRTMTSYPSLAKDLRNAGASWVDEEVVVDRGLVSSRTPRDLAAFNVTLVEEIGKGARPHRFR